MAACSTAAVAGDANFLSGRISIFRIVPALKLRVRDCECQKRKRAGGAGFLAAAAGMPRPDADTLHGRQ